MTSTGWLPRVGVGLVCLFLAVGAVRMIVATDTLDRAIAAFNDDNCVVASSQAETTLAAVNSEPQAAAILAYCDARDGRHREAIREMGAAARLDPGHWRYRYGLGVVRALAGRDPRPDLARARRLNPLGGVPRTGAAAELARSGPKEWRRVAVLAEQKVD